MMDEIVDKLEDVIRLLCMVFMIVLLTAAIIGIPMLVIGAMRVL